MGYKTYGNDLLYLIILFVLLGVFILVAVVYSVINKHPLPSAAIPNQSSYLYTGIGMVCNNTILGCPNNLTCFGSSASTNGKCYADVGQPCKTIYDCVSSSTKCDGVCILDTSPGAINTGCNPRITSSQCNNGLQCLLSYENDYRCLIPLGGSGCGNNNTSCGIISNSGNGVKCSSNTCVISQQHGKGCSTSADCGGLDFCSSGKCEPSPNIAPGQKGSYCSPFSDLGLTPCNEGLQCNASEVYNFPYGIGTCTDSISTIGGKCDATSGCIPFSYCGGSGVCQLPDSPNQCEIPGSGGICVDPYVCTAVGGVRECLGKSTAMCNTQSQCVSGVCSPEYITKISKSGNNEFPGFSTFSSAFTDGQFLTSNLSLAKPTPDRYIFVLSGKLQSPETDQVFWVYDSPTSATFNKVTVTISDANITSFVLKEASIVDDDTLEFFVLWINQITTSSPGGYDTIYIIPYTNSSTLSITTANKQYSYYSTPVSQITQYYVNGMDNNSIYLFITGATQGNIQNLTRVTSDGFTLVNVLDTGTTQGGGQPITAQGLTFFGRYLDITGKDPVSESNFFLIVGDTLYFFGRHYDFYQLISIPAKVAYTVSQVNTYATFELMYTDDQGLMYYFAFTQGKNHVNYQIPGYSGNQGIAQDITTPSSFFSFSRTCQ